MTQINMTEAQRNAHNDCDMALGRMEGLIFAAYELATDHPSLGGTGAGDALLAVIDALRDKLRHAIDMHSAEWEAAKV